MKLNLGCKNVTLPGFTNVDLYWGAEVRDNAITLEKFADESAEEINASHLLEHLGYHEGLKALKTWYRVLKAGGTLTVDVPDVSRSIYRWIEDKERGAPDLWGFPSHCIWGQQTDEGEFHKWGYTMESLIKSVEWAGFKVVMHKMMDGFDPRINGPIPSSVCRVVCEKP